MGAQSFSGGCFGCIYLNRFKPRPDEQQRYGFGDEGYGCRHPQDGGVYVRNPAEPTCLRGPVSGVSA